MGGCLKGCLLLPFRLIVLPFRILWFPFRMFGYASRTNCDVCGGRLKKKSYSWTIKGKLSKVCPNCNRNISARKSRDAVRRL